MASNDVPNDVSNDADNTLQPMYDPTGPAPSLPNDILLQTIAADNTAAVASPAASDAPLSAEGRTLSLKVSLADLVARASHHYAQKHYEDAAEIYSQAADMQAEMNGEMSPDNAEILFLYGRSLFKVGQSKSDVLGGRAPQGEGEGKGKGNGGKKATGKKRKAKTPEVVKEEEGGESAAGAAEEKVAKEVAGRAAEEGKKEGQKELEAKGQLFQFKGDENWDDTDEEGDDAGEGGEDEEEEEEEDDDLATAFEILDLARVLLKKKLAEKLAAAEASEGKGKEVSNVQGGDPEIRHIKERLADTHDLLMEISLESERYPNAIADAKECLKYHQELLPEDHEIIAEAHFKLSLALEFASVTQQNEEDGAAAGAAPKEVNQELRDEACKELTAAIDSTKMKLQNKEVELATLNNPEENDILRRQITDTKEVIADMEQRLVDLRGPPIDMQAALGVESLGGLLGGLLGEPAGQTEARIEEAKKTATDLTGLVRKKDKPAPAPAAAAAEVSNGKRKAEEDAVVEDSEASKKARTEPDAV